MTVVNLVMPIVEAFKVTDHVEVVLQNKHVLLIDEIDLDLLSSYHWFTFCPRKGYTYYVRSDTKCNVLLLHRLILERMLGRTLSRNERVDHINRNGLDNRRSNLRLATHSQNMINRKLQANNSSGYRGVYWHTRDKKWISQIRVNNKSVYLGCFLEIQDAVSAYQDAAKKYFGDFAPQDGK